MNNYLMFDKILKVSIPFFQCFGSGSDPDLIGCVDPDPDSWLLLEPWGSFQEFKQNKEFFWLN